MVQTLERICTGAVYPKSIKVDNASKFIFRDLGLWAYANNVTLVFAQPGKPTDNGFLEAFNSKRRVNCLNAYWCLNLAESPEKSETWRRHDNEERLYRTIGYNVPIAMYNRGSTTLVIVIRARKIQSPVVQNSASVQSEQIRVSLRS